jgi:hypothetical protein
MNLSVKGRGLDSPVSANGSSASFCGHEIRPSRSMKSAEFFDHVIDCKLLKNGFAQ